MFYFSKLGNSRINPFENQMTLARPPMVLSTHANDYVILRCCKIVVTIKLQGKNYDADSVIKSDFFIIFQNNEN